ncbi:glycosyltransferase [Aciduliprofundum sp. MAR08-339]|uniref:glycosyltransferase family 4 protein n=1 Tax=Aciduliprofundum sp. (strain MAR08-339) TaxID=673860 RepID=UPI0002A49203|nr:glycosyltransferase [Aciduliprofundum sp. MAR08-339]
MKKMMPHIPNSYVDNIRIAFFGELSQTFTKRDYDILKKHYYLEVLQPPKTKKEWMKYPKRVKDIVKRNDVVFGWFAGWHTLPAVYYARKYGKKSIIVVGGYDAACEPEINYGAFSNLKEKIPAKYVLEHADLLLAVSQFTKNEIMKRVGPRDVLVVYNGVDVDKFKLSVSKDRKLVITVASAKNDLRRIKVKGLDTFVKAAKYLPDTKFLVIGVDGSARKYLENIAPKNVEIIGYISRDEDLVNWLQRAKVICQLSYYEAFGLAPAEGMACGCIPVVTKDKSGMSEFVREVGFYVPYGDPKATADAIKKAVEAPLEWGLRAREIIEKEFSIKKREEILIKIIKNVLWERESI